jgi:hypothetical protein
MQEKAMHALPNPIACVVLMLAAATAAAQSDTGKARRGSVPAGISQDGNGASEGAIKGGSIEPTPGAGEALQRKDLERCKQLTGTLRAECLRDAGAQAGDLQSTPSGSIRRNPALEAAQELPGAPLRAAP